MLRYKPGEHYHAHNDYLLGAPATSQAAPGSSRGEYYTRNADHNLNPAAFFPSDRLIVFTGENPRVMTMFCEHTPQSPPPRLEQLFQGVLCQVTCVCSLPERHARGSGRRDGVS